MELNLKLVVLKMPARLTKDERIELILLYGEFSHQNDIFRKIARCNALHPDRQSKVFDTTVKHLLDRFKSTGSVNETKRSGRPKTSTDNDTSTDVLAMFNATPTMSTRMATVESGVDRRSIQRILHKEKMTAYKFFITQELIPEDCDRRLEFSQNVAIKALQIPQFANSIIFSDEACFFLKGNINRHNCRYWSKENPRQTLPTKIQGGPKVMVWCGLCSKGVIGPFFFNDGTVNGVRYVDMLQNKFLPAFRALLNAEEQNVFYFQQDGCPAHYSLVARAWLDANFANRWIGRRGPLQWPARSPDLAPPDFFLWGYLKDKIFTSTRPATMMQLQDAIRHYCAIVNDDKDLLASVMVNWNKRIQMCTRHGGSHFEQFL